MCRLGNFSPRVEKKHSVTFVKYGARIDWLDSLLISGNEVVVLYHADATQMLFEAIIYVLWKRHPQSLTEKEHIVN